MPTNTIEIFAFIGCITVHVRVVPSVTQNHDSCNGLGNPKPRHLSGATWSAPLLRGEHMKQVPKIILRVVAVTVGSAYFLAAFYLVTSMPELTNIRVAIGWYRTALGQMLIGLILVGDVDSRTSRALQEMFEAHRSSARHFGHVHINREFLIGETRFRCLAEIAICELPEQRKNRCQRTA